MLYKFLFTLKHGRLKFSPLLLIEHKMDFLGPILGITLILLWNLDLVQTPFYGLYKVRASEHILFFIFHKINVRY